MAYQKDTPYSPTLQERSNREATKTPGSGPTGSEIVQLIGKLQDLRGFRDQHWEGGFEDYLQIVRHNPKVTRTAFQRMYDMILSKGTREYYEYKKKILHYNFFDDKEHAGIDAIFGLDIPLMKLVNVFKSAAQRYGTEKRVLLLHGPVGSSKSTIVRLLKKGLEDYSRTPEGALYSFVWVLQGEIGRKKTDQTEVIACPMHEEALHLIPIELTGDINYRKIAEYGSDSDPRAFNFDGEFNVANRGLIEFIEVLKLEVAFLYDLLGASQEHKIKPKKFPQTDIDEVIIGHTNEPEY